MNSPAHILPPPSTLLNSLFKEHPLSCVCFTFLGPHLSLLFPCMSHCLPRKLLFCVHSTADSLERTRDNVIHKRVLLSGSLVFNEKKDIKQIVTYDYLSLITNVMHDI